MNLIQGKVCTPLAHNDVDYTGADISGAAVNGVTDVDACAALCVEHPLCFAFTYVSWGYVFVPCIGRPQLNLST